MGIAIGDINPITMEPMMLVEEVKMKSSLFPPNKNDYGEIDSFFSNGNDPFTCNPFNSNNSVDHQGNYIVNIPLFEKPRKIMGSLRKKVITRNFKNIYCV